MKTLLSRSKTVLGSIRLHSGQTLWVRRMKRPTCFSCGCSSSGNSISRSANYTTSNRSRTRNVTELLFSILRVAPRCSGRIHDTMQAAPRRVGSLCMLIVLAYMFLGSFSVVPPGKNPAEMAPAIDPTYYLHRTLPQTPIPVPFGLRMNTTAPPSGPTETTLQFNKGTNYYWYSDPLTPGCAASGTWTFYVWADTATTLSTLDVRLDLTSSSGGNSRSPSVQKRDSPQP